MKGILRASVNALPLWVRHRIRLIPGLAGLQRWLISRFLSGEPFAHTINAGPARGLRFEVSLPLDKAVWAGTYEVEFSQALHDAVRPGDICYDIGGYRGYMAGVLAMAGAAGVIVFEPFPRNIVALKRLMQLNPGLPLKLEERALGNTDGVVAFHVMSDSSMGKLSGSPFQAQARYEEVIRVPISKLDSVVRDRNVPPPAVMKIDVEGAEADVLKGGMETLAAFHPRIFLEAHSKALADECCEILATLGYSIKQLGVPQAADEATRHVVATFPK